MLAALSLAGQASRAQSTDSVRMIEMQEVQVTSTRATAQTPVAYTNIGKKEILKRNFGQDLPFLLLMSPSVVATSDAGAGIGYTSLRVRGTDATRINVTANGIPMNDAESHSLFWVNMPDFASSVEDIQLQRGAGTSTNGAGAFGGSVNLKTEASAPTAYGELSAAYGSFNTHKETIKVGTGLIGGHWAFDARLSNIQSDGYVRRASVDLKSYFAQAGYYGRNTVVKFITFAGKEKTYHAWNGIDAEQLKTDRRYNSCGEIWQPVYDAAGKPVLDESGEQVTELDGFYKDQTDNYIQRNYQLLFTQYLSERWNLNLALHYTDGEGYYQEYKNAASLLEYGLTPYAGDPDRQAYVEDGKVTSANLVRQKKMDNGFGGGVFSLNYNGGRLQASLGGAANKYDGDHFGRVIWVQNYVGYLSPDHEYYRNNGTKVDANVYARADWTVTKGLHLYGDLQYRHINYRIKGQNDKWDWTSDHMQLLDVDETYNFFNPKAGIFYDLNEHHNLYASFAVAQKEPTRNNYTDARFDVTPRSERLYDYEAGYNFRSRYFSAGVNFYYMKYKDQLVLTGETNDIGEPLADNVPKSYRAGVELMAGVQFTHWLRWDVNATFSRNRIKNYTEILYDDNYEAHPVYLGSTPISFSPDVIANSLLSASFQNWDISLQSSYVGEQYLTNTKQEELKLDAYFVNNLRLGYTFRLPSLRSISLGVLINNLFNEMYCSNGGGGSTYAGEENGQPVYSNYAWYFPQAGTNVLANIVIRF